MEVSDKDKEEFRRIFDLLCEYFEKNLSERIFKLYWAVLKKYPLSDIKEALLNYIESPNKGIYFPKICFIKRDIDEIKKNAPRETQKTWEEELKDLQNGLRHFKRLNAQECIRQFENKIKEHIDLKFCIPEKSDDIE